jgi:hypothetical protein
VRPFLCSETALTRRRGKNRNWSARWRDFATIGDLAKVKSRIWLAFAQRRSLALLSALRSVIACSQWDEDAKEAEETDDGCQ